MVPFDQGYEAFLDGQDVDANPFELETDEWLDWRRGWYSASDGDLV